MKGTLYDMLNGCGKEKNVPCENVYLTSVVKVVGGRETIQCGLNRHYQLLRKGTKTTLFKTLIVLDCIVNQTITFFIDFTWKTLVVYVAPKTRWFHPTFSLFWLYKAVVVLIKMLLRAFSDFCRLKAFSENKIKQKWKKS